MTNTKKFFYKWDDFNTDVKSIITEMSGRNRVLDGIFAIPKGGLVLGVTLANRLELPLYTSKYEFIKNHFKNKNILIVDDISDTGRTLLSIPEIGAYKSVTLFIKQGTKFTPTFYCRVCNRDVWVVYPWE